MIKKLLIVFITIIALKVNAQQGANSPYSFYGIGSLSFKGTIENQSMGGLSIYTDSTHVNLRNPASYGGSLLSSLNNEARLVKYTVGGSHSTTTLKTNSDSDKLTSTTFDYLAIAIPVGKFGFGFGLQPYTSVGYKLENFNSLNNISHRYSGDGGVNKVFLGFGYQVTKDLGVGLNFDYNFGNIQNNIVQFVYNDENELTQYQSRQADRSDLSGISLNLGLTYNKMLNDKLELKSGITYAPKSKLTSENQREFATIAVNQNTGAEIAVNSIDENNALPENLKETELTIPSRFSVGAGIGEPLKWFAGAEYVSQNSSDFSSQLLDDPTNAYQFENASSFSLGGFYIPNYNSLTSYFNRVVYRSGLRFGNSGLNINNESIKEFGISFGVGLPVGRSLSNVNLGFEIGKRGTTNQNLVQENFFNFKVSLSFIDRWFQKRKYN